MSDTLRLGLTLLEEGQSNGDVTFNQALQLLDVLVQAGIKDRHLTAPPGGEATGDCYLVAAGATGGWAGQDGNFAVTLDNGTSWIFITPVERYLFWVDDENLFTVYDGSAWRDFIKPQTAVPTVLHGNTDGEIGGLTISAAYSQSEVTALRDKCEELADDVRSLRAALVTLGLVAEA